jgi:hypothetical protein
MREEVPSWSWQEGRIDPSQPSLQIYYVPDIENPETAYLVALLSMTPTDRLFTVGFLPQSLPASLAPGPIIEEVKAELNFFLIEKREQDPMKYLRYHCTTASNLYSHVQWAVSDR